MRANELEVEMVWQMVDKVVVGRTDISQVKTMIILQRDNNSDGW